MNVPEEEKYLNTEKEIRAMLVELVGGRAAEEIVFDTVTTGASNDIERATDVARAMITQYGMSEKFGLIALETPANRYLDGQVVMNCSDVTAAEVDQEVMRVLKDAYEEAKRLLSENRDALDKIAEFLIEKETITGKEFMKIFRKVKGLPEPEENEEKQKSGRVTEKPKVDLKKEEIKEENPNVIELPDTSAEEENPEKSEKEKNLEISKESSSEGKKSEETFSEEKASEETASESSNVYQIEDEEEN